MLKKDFSMFETIYFVPVATSFALKRFEQPVQRLLA